jgi:hypothetical protein
MAKGKSKGDADGVETQDDQIVSQDDVTSAVEPTTAPDPAPPVVEEHAAVAVEEPAAPAESGGVKVGDYIDTPYGQQRVRKVYADGLVVYATPAGFLKKLRLPQG